tara:strand:- start:1059 stop:1655 length:597 start_codon:yes stop_codon:yes gene_type:complete
MDKKFWLNNPKILFNKEKLLEIWPYSHLNYNEKMNATTRFVIYTSLLGYVFLNNYLILLLGIVIIVSLLLIYNYNNIESFDSANVGTLDEGKHTSKNPLYNVLNTDYVDNVNKDKLRDEYNQNKESEINHQAKQFIYETNKSNKDIGNIFSNFLDNLNFETSMRQFYINPITTIPNGQDDFLNYCYGNLHSEKPLLIY